MMKFKCSVDEVGSVSWEGVFIGCSWLFIGWWKDKNHGNDNGNNNGEKTILQQSYSKQPSKWWMETHWSDTRFGWMMDQ